MQRQFMQEPFQPLQGQTFFPGPFMQQPMMMDFQMQSPFMCQPGMFPTLPYQHMQPGNVQQQICNMLQEINAMVRRIYEDEYQTMG